MITGNVQIKAFLTNGERRDHSSSSSSIDASHSFALTSALSGKAEGEYLDARSSDLNASKGDLETLCLSYLILILIKIKILTLIYFKSVLVK